jgi:hypothetical protein
MLFHEVRGLLLVRDLIYRGPLGDDPIAVNKYIIS